MKILSKFIFNLLATNEKRSARNGFSLIELMIVISLFAIVTVVVSVSYIGFQGREDVRSAALQVKNDVRYTMSRAKSGDKVANTAPPVGCRTQIDEVGVSDDLIGWYAHFDTSDGNNTTYNISGVCLSGGLEQKFGEKAIKLPKDVYISGITTVAAAGGVPASATDVVVLFRPLELEVLFYNSAVLGVGVPAVGDQASFVDNTGTSELVNAITTVYEVSIEFSTPDGQLYFLKVNKSGKIEESQT